MSDDKQRCIDDGREVVATEIGALQRLHEHLDDGFAEAVDLILECPGKVVVCGVGKSGIVARKIAATFASTGTSAVFLHGAEALHGDLGVLYPNDVLILISKSGESDEVVKLLPSIETIGPKIIAFTGSAESRIGQAAHVVLDCGVEREADALNLAPTASATASLVLGDALAVVVASRKKLTPERFALSHPGGALGCRLTVKVEHLMHGDDEQPLCGPAAGMREVVVVMSSKGMGAVNIVEPDGTLAGIITDGDMRRAIQKHDNVLELTAGDIMTKGPIRVTLGTMAIDALHVMEDRPSQIMVLPVVDDAGKAVGILRLHDIVKAGL